MLTLGYTDTEWDFKGEAITVDLGERGVLFATMIGNPHGVDYPAHIIPEAFGVIPQRFVQAHRTLPDVHWPQMVVFEDMSDPMSVKMAYQHRLDWQASRGKNKIYEVTNNIASLLGEGVKIHSVTVEMTQDRVTYGIDKYLPWLDGLDGGYLDGGFSARGAPHGLYGANFKREKFL